VAAFGAPTAFLLIVGAYAWRMEREDQRRRLERESESRRDKP
jgi:putative solute:sodium symporter small subunit